MTEQPAIGYPEPKIHTLAQIVVTINGQAHKWGWADARTRKEQVAKWLRAQTVRGDAKLTWSLKQRAAEVPWRETAGWTWNGAAGPGLEYGAVTLLGTPEWGRSR